MRISNIAQYAGGADDVVALEVLEGNELIKTINVSGIDFSAFDATAFDVDMELFKAEVSYRGSSITINSLTREAVTGDVTTNPVQLTVDIDNTTIGNLEDGSFDLKIPETLLSSFGANLHAEPDASNPYIVAMKVQWTDGTGFNRTKRSIRFLFLIRYQPVI